jgi:hypothetical protein
MVYPIIPLFMRMAYDGGVIFALNMEKKIKGIYSVFKVV